MDNDNDKKICPFCGAEININAKKCRFCDNWLDEEIECPFCAEKIKASAKKCRFCGEWLPNKNIEKKENKIDINYLKNISKNKIMLILGIMVGICLLAVIVWRFFLYIPSCSNTTILTKLEDKLHKDYTDIQNLDFDKTSIVKLAKKDKGYSCRINATADNSSLSLEYSYNKTSINDYDFTTKIILPDCYDGIIKKILTNLIKESDYLNFKNIVSGVDIEKASVENYDKDLPKYTCEADVTLAAKPGRAFVLSAWDNANADTQIKCKVRYESLFCGNGYTICAGLNRISNCSYEEE